MLQVMQQPAPPAPSSTAASFAGLLAALTSPAPKAAPAWVRDDLGDDLEDDVATLSYERALRTHARYRPAAPSDEALTQVADPRPSSAPRPPASAQAAAPAPTQTSHQEREAFAAEDAEPVRLGHPSVPLGRDLKCASITIRLSQTECAQLHRRAAEAGLTVSAYLRSCTFEVESLRALVKDTMAQLRAATSAAKPGSANPARSFLRGWFGRFLLLFHGRQRVASA